MNNRNNKTPNSHVFKTQRPLGKRIITKILIARIISGFMVFFMVIGINVYAVIPTIAYAFPGNYFWQPENMHVRIYHVASGLSLGISNDDNDVNGGRLELQRYDEANQLQIFYLRRIATRNDNGTFVYQIRVHGENNKVIEVRNSSQDDWGEVAQWEDGGQQCAYWQFYTEGPDDDKHDVTCAIQNWNSGKMLNVAGGEGIEGNDLIQYHEDGTTAEIFRIECVSDDDTIAGATWTRDWSNASELYWGLAKNTKYNREKYYTPINQYTNDYIRYPVNYGDQNGIWLGAVLWMDGNMMNDMRSYLDPPSSGWNDLKNALGESATDFAVDRIADVIGAGSVPNGSIMGIVGIIATGQERNQKAIFKELMNSYNKVKIEIWYNFTSGSWGTSYRIYINNKSDTYWDGNKSSIGGNTYYCSYNNTNIDGTIEYFFK